MKLLNIPIEEIKPAKYNPRKDLQPEDQEYKMLAKGMAEFGLVQPLVWNKRSGNLVGGHQRLKVLKHTGVKQVDVSVVDLPPEKEKALNIALNKISGEWDFPALKDLLLEIDVGDMNMDLTGWDASEIEELMTEECEKGEASNKCPECGYEW